MTNAEVIGALQKERKTALHENKIAFDIAIKALKGETVTEFADRCRECGKQKKGRWNCGDDMFEYAICSSCKHETGEAWEYAKRNFKYCPNCGAKMT